MACYCGHKKNEHRWARDGGANAGDCTHENCNCDGYLNPVYSYKDGRIKEKWYKNIDDSNGKRIRNTLTQEGQSI